MARILGEAHIGHDNSLVLTVAVLCVVFFSTTIAEANQSVYFEGDVVLGGLFPIHSKGTGESKNACGSLREEGVQRMEAMLYAVDLINQELKLQSNLTLGVDIRDTCSEDNYALEQSLSFVASKFVTQINPDAWNAECSYLKKPVAGVVGAAASDVSVIIANFLGIFKIPQISYASTSSALSDKAKYEYFSRVVPSDAFQTKAIIDIVKKFEWKYVSTVFSAGNYGEGGTEEFTTLARDEGICIATSEKIYSTEESDLDLIVERLSEKPNARGVIAFVDEDDMDDLLRAIARNNKTGRFTLIGSDSWGTKVSPVEGDNKEVANGSITILPSRTSLSGFDEYFMSKNSTNNDRNVWWREFWENHFDCSFDESSDKEACKDDDRISEETGYVQEGYVQFVVDSVLAFVYALEDMLIEQCGPYSISICDKMYDTIFDGSEFLSFIRKVEFNGSANNAVYFDKNGDAPGRYNIYQYREMNGSFDYFPVGEWDPDNWNFFIEKTTWKSWDNAPASFCSHPCQLGEVKKVQTGDDCCWVCVQCNDTSYVEGDQCEACAQGFGPDANRTGCLPLNLEYIGWDSAWAYVPALFSSAGLVCVCLVLAVFVRNNGTPIIKASGRELMYILLIGIGFCYACTFLLLAKPTDAICYLQRISLGLVMTMCYSALLVKTVRIARIFNSKQKTYRMRYTSPFSQIVICFLLILVQLVIAVVWLGLVPPRAVEVYPVGRKVLVCNTKESELFGMLLYSFVLIVMCTVYAFKTRKIPENFNEAKFIGFTSYTTCIVWIAFIAIYFGVADIDDNHTIQTSALCTTLSISASTALACLFVPKLYIVIAHPSKNIIRRPTISGSRRSVSNNGSVYRSQNESFSSDVGPQKTQDSSLSTTRETFTDLSSASNS